MAMLLFPETFGLRDMHLFHKLFLGRDYPTVIQPLVPNYYGLPLALAPVNSPAVQILVVVAVMRDLQLRQ